MVQVYSAQQTVQNLLYPGEQLLWWDRPDPAKMKSFLTLTDVNTALVYSVGMLIIGVFPSLCAGSFYVSMKVLGVLSGIFLILLSSRLLLLLYENRLKVQLRGPYRKWTVYAVTNMTAMIVVLAPGAEICALKYYPHEINEPECIIDADGSGTIIFGKAHTFQTEQYRLPLKFSGRFYGIAYVREVAALLEQLRYTHKLRVEYENANRQSL